VYANGTLYTVTAEPPIDDPRILGNYCVSINGGSWGEGRFVPLTSGGTLDFIIGFLPQKGWFQTSTGSVYAATQLTSSIPSSATNPYFSLGSPPGIVSYGTGYDFSLSSANKGESQVSSKKWLVNQQLPSKLFYEQFIHKLGIPGTETPLTGLLTDVTKPTCPPAPAPCILYANGTMTTAGSPWTIGGTEPGRLVYGLNGLAEEEIKIVEGK
jgi:hypothetical protein